MIDKIIQIANERVSISFKFSIPNNRTSVGIVSVQNLTE